MSFRKSIVCSSVLVSSHNRTRLLIAAATLSLVTGFTSNAQAQFRLNVGGSHSGISVGPGGSGVIGRFNQSGGFQGVGVGRAENIHVFPGNSGGRSGGVSIGSGRSSGITIGTSGRSGGVVVGTGGGGVSIGSGGNVGVVVTNPGWGSRPPTKPCPRSTCPPSFAAPPNYGSPADSVPHVEVRPGHVVVDTNMDPIIGVARIQSLMRTGKLDQAADLAANLVDLHADKSEVLEAYSITRFARGEFEDSAAAMYDALAISIEWSWRDVRQYFTTQEAYLAPLRDLQKAAKETPDSASLRFLLSSHYVMLDAVDQARSSIELTNALIPDDKVVAALQNQLPPVLAEAE